MRTFLLLTLTATLGLLVAAGLPSCSNGSEGDRCSRSGDNQGNDECQDGLICTTINSPTLGYCCPPNRALATTPVCSVASSGLGGDAAPPRDGSTSDAPAADGSSDAATDAPAADAPGADSPTSDGPANDAPAADAPVDAPPG